MDIMKSLGSMDIRLSAEQMDVLRQKNIAYEYMCHLEEAKRWLEVVLKEDLPPVTILEESLRNGVILAKLGNFMTPSLVPINNIFDKELKRFNVAGLQFRHTDNINYFLKALASAGLPVTFLPETTDVYNRKNMPRVIYCIHALSSHLFKLGRAPLIQDLYGQIKFSDEEINDVYKDLKYRGVQMPEFKRIGRVLSETVTKDTPALDEALLAINTAIDRKKGLMLALGHPAAGLQHIVSRLSQEYQLVLCDAKQAKAQAALNRSLNDSCSGDHCDLLTQAEVQGYITAVNTDAAWNAAIAQDSQALLEILPLLGLDNVNSSLKSMVLYCSQATQLDGTSKEMQSLPESCSQSTLQRQGLQKAVKNGNAAALSLKKCRKAMAAINSALDQDTWQPLLAALQHPALGLLSHGDEFLAPLFHREMREDRIDSQKDLSLTDVQESLRVLRAVGAVTLAVDCANVNATWIALQNPLAFFSGLDPTLQAHYYQVLSNVRKKKVTDKEPCLLLNYTDIQMAIDHVNDSNKYNNNVILWLQNINSAVQYCDLGLLSGCLTDPVGQLSSKVEPSDIPLYMQRLQVARQRKCSDLWLEDVHCALRNVTQDAQWIVALQARARGYLLRRRTAHFVQSVQRIQSWWRRVLQRKRQRGKQLNARDLLAQRNQAATLIQAVWRGHAARRVFLVLLRSARPDFNAVRHFAPVLRECAYQRDEEWRLQELKGQVVQAIRKNKQLEKQLDTMDIKIGLLVQNRIALRDVDAHGTSLAQLTSAAPTQHALKSFTKESRDRLQAYQHLLYTLQTQPRYLSQLLVLFPQSATSKTLLDVIQALFSYGSSHREQYLLLRLLECALVEEVRTKCQEPTNVLTANFAELKMAVNFARQHNALRQIIGPLVEQVMNDSTLCMETNPVDIYKSWRSQLEMESRTTSTLPYNVSVDQALGYAEVRTRFDSSLTSLRNITLKFVNTIVATVNQLPYSLRYIANVLRFSLAEKFPRAADKELLKIVGHLVYFSYMNSAIVAPDAFDIISLPPDRTLTIVQRRNLASVAKILQFAATKKGFGEESLHLMCLNPFIVSCHDELKKFFASVCCVCSLEDHFMVDRYSDATLIDQPMVYMSLQELCDVHGIVLKYADRIAPDPMDPLHELLDDLGGPPCIATLLAKPIDDPMMPTLAKTEVCLSLSNKFEVPDDDETDVKKQFIRAKELLVWGLPGLAGQSLQQALMTRETASQVALYKQALVLKRSNIEVPTSLSQCKSELLQLLNRLELSGRTTSADGYQSLVTALAQDARDRGRDREDRRREMKTLRAAKSRLEQKTHFYEDQVEYYNEYIKKCLENLNAGKKNVHMPHSSGKQPGKLRTKQTLRYTAARLREKGVLIEVQDLPVTQLKNVQLEITPTDQHGVFAVKGKFMGVVMEKVDVDIQHLLKLQFEGTTIMDMFGKVIVNINLLLALLNRKFYGKV